MILPLRVRGKVGRASISRGGEFALS